MSPPLRLDVLKLLPLAALVVCLDTHALAQSPSEMPISPSQATPVPLSNPAAQQPPVSVQRSSSGSSGGVNSSSSSVSVQGPYSGSAPQGQNTGSTLHLSLADALARGLKSNLGEITNTQQVAQSRAQEKIAASALRPNVNSVISEEVERLNLRTQGVLSSSFPMTAQLNYFDARAARLRQTVFDFVQLENLHTARANLAATLDSARNARDLIVLAVSGGYLELISSNARVIAAAAEVDSARAIFQQATDRLAAGLDARIDVTRSQVQLQVDQQRLRSLQADLDTEKLQYARVIGLPPGQRFAISEDYGYSPLTNWTVDSALSLALKQRSDLHAASEGVRAAESALKAARAERLPNLTLNADWGAAGLRPDAEAHSVYSVYGTLTIPLYQGGRTSGDIQNANAALRARQAELEDVRAQVDEDVRRAFINLDEAADQVAVAESNRNLAHETLQQARDRFTAGISDTVELVQAEQSVVEADDSYISAVFQHNLAKVTIARALGNAEQNLTRLLR